MASITDVARLAGVSTATVSRVVSAAPYAVSPATRARVLDAARALDYVPNALARGLHKSHVPVVGVIVHDITDPYFAEVVRGVEDAASVGGFLVVTCSSDRIAERELSYVRLLRSMRAATVIFAGSGLTDPALNAEVARHVTAMRAYGAAVVHLSPHAAGEADIGVDNAAGIAGMVAALVELGHRRIAFLAGPTSLYVSLRRQEGYRRGLAEAGIAYDERLVVSTGFNQDGGALGIDALLAGDAPFTAVCAANDLLALGALQRLGVARHRGPGRGLRRRLRRHPDRGDGHTRPVHGAAAAARDRSARVRLRGGPAGRWRADRRGAPDRARHARVDRGRRRPARSSGANAAPPSGSR